MGQLGRLALAWLAIVLVPYPALAAEPAQPASGKAKGSAPAPTKPTRERERAELFGGFSHAHSGSAGLNGWEVSGSLPFHQRLQFVVDLAHHSGSFAGADLSQSTFLAGAARSWHLHALRPFARVLLGIVHTTTTFGGLSDSGNHLAVGAGAGATYPVFDRLGIRGQLDLLLSHGNGTWDTSPRLGVGLSYRFGK